LKAGQYEPYAFIKLNPKMMNKRYRDKAVKSFETVVAKKKTDKRKLKEGKSI
jgi:peroxiredoxin family protein